MSAQNPKRETAVLVKSPQIEIRRTRVGAAACYTFDGNCASMSDAVRGSIPTIYDDACEQDADLLLDVSKLSFAHSTMIALWVTLVGWAVEQGRRVVLVGADKALRDLLEIMGILSQFERADTLAQATELLSA